MNFALTVYLGIGRQFGRAHRLFRGGHQRQTPLPTGSRPHFQNHRVGQPASRRSRLRERPVGGFSVVVQGASQDAARRRAPDRRLHLVRGKLF